ncbi:helicase-exonuclease AddAB subunit AddA [Lachnospiraceae bacterium 50-23]|jgi:ATP-dependent helicase/nuclease subunit A|nr:helicase-exonuclease AddAB subunit AddA [Dorea sp.]GFI35933.1 ATP-dependent helicase/nuclease subunit A [Lachnospiraceae bacterium]
MSVAWTKEQQKVIDLRGRNILVSAAAGSGKTAVLVERIITMLTAENNPVDVDRLLIVTFTEAAAAEMKERIRTAIEKKLSEQPEDEHLKQQATLIHNARITTIHSFCLSVIKDHFHAIDLDPGFRIGEEGELKLLRHDVLGEVLEECYEEGRRRFLDFVSAYGTGRSDKKIEELILKIYEYSRSYPASEWWLSSCVDAYGAETLEELEGSEYTGNIKKNVRRYLEDAGRLLAGGIAICCEADGPAVYEEILEADLRIIEELKQKDSFAGLGESMRNISWMRLTPNRDKSVSEEKAAQVKAIRENVKGMVKDLISQYFYEEPEEMLLDIKRCRPMVQEVAELVRRFAVRFEEKKRSQNMIDFSDMEQYALQILTEKTEDHFLPSSIAKEYQEQFLEIMIDEYQDSNLIQETILTSISTICEGKYNVFMVGDVKQSIYRFRLSRPELFMEKFDTYSIEDSRTQRIDLHKNFRSRREVLDSVNYIFRQIMTRGLGGIAYDEAAALYVGAKYEENPGCMTEVLAVDGDVEWEARAIAVRIRELLEEGNVTDKKSGALRPVRYSDIVILTRSVSGFADVFAEVLNREGIPAHAGTREGYFSSREIGVLLDYLRILDNFRQDVPLAAVLCSVIGGLSREEIAIVKSEFQELPFYKAVSRYRQEGESEDVRRKLDRCLGKLDEIRECVPYTPMHELLYQILEDTGYGDYVSAMPAGVQRKANVEMLIEKARAFEATSYKGLFHFVRYIEQLQKYNVDYGEASVEDEQSNIVRIMTIHKSKGLEFPIVFAAGMGKRFNMQDVRSSIVLHAGMGIGMDCIDLELRVKSPTIIKKIIQKEEQLDSLGEELRVLYVACTRAKEKLIITGTLPDPEKKLAGYEVAALTKEDAIGFWHLSKAAAFWDFVFPALLRKGEAVPADVKILLPEDIVRQEAAEEVSGRITKAALEQWDTHRVYDPSAKEQLEEQFRYRYPHDGRGKKLKFTVSELKKRIYMQEVSGSEEGQEGELLYEEPEVIPLIPRFLQKEEELSGASRGTAYHRVLELLDFRKDYSPKEAAASIEAFYSEGKISEAMKEAIVLKDILQFLASPCAGRMRKSACAGRLWKEQPFVLGIDACDIYPGEQEGEQVLVQGIIDVYFEEEDGLVLLDYKTDRVHSPRTLIDKYHGQLDYYARALEQLTQKKVKEKIIYSFALEKEVRLP